MPAARPLAERFWEKVNKDGPIIRPELGPCWVWTGTISKNGYGKMGPVSPGGRSHSAWAHRVGWIIQVGPIPDEAHILHRCDHRPCVRGEHLLPGTPAENLADMVAKGRSRFGERHWNSTLTASDAIDIRSLAAFGATRKVLSAEFGVSHLAIGKIVRGERWRTA